MERVIKYIDGVDIHHWFRLGFLEVEAAKKKLNAINVFPVADGDTGTNLSSTLKAMAEKPNEDQAFGEMFRRISEVGISNARGNSGVIFAAYVSGMANEGRQFEKVTHKEFAEIANRAVSYIYRAIENPIEGTMVSVIKDWAEYLLHNHHKFEDFGNFLHSAYLVAVDSLADTTNRLEVLRKKQLVDSGAMGFVGFLRGVNQFFLHQTSDGKRGDLFANLMDEVEQSTEIEHEESLFRYCTEFVFVTNMDEFFVRSIASRVGDSLILYKSGSKIKVHIHTNEPAKLIWSLMPFGEIEDQKVDDMHYQSTWGKADRKGQINRIGLLVDSIADLPMEFGLKNEVEILPLTLMIEGSSFLDKVTVDANLINEYVNKNKLKYPTSSLPEAGRIRSKIEKMLEIYEQLIIITVSDKLSGTYNLARTVGNEINEGHKEPRVVVFNSKLNSGAEGLLVKRAVELRKENRTADQIINELEKLRDRSRILVCLESFESAVRSGRVPDTIGRLGKTLRARPIMTLNKEGAGAAYGIGFTKKSITKKIMNEIIKAKQQKGIDEYCIVHNGANALARDYQEKLVKLLGIEPSYISEISSVTALHVGKGCVAVAFTSKE